MVRRPAKNGKGRRKLGQDPIVYRELSRIHLSPENRNLYRPVDCDDPDIIALADSIREHGVREPLVITQDGELLSGHRRRVAADLAGLDEVPCRVEPFSKHDDPDRFTVLLREYNRQRVKSFAEKFREEAVSTDPEKAYESLMAHRFNEEVEVADTLSLGKRRKRAEISDAKRPFLEAVQSILVRRRRYWPLSDRQIHYALLNDPPLIHAKKPGSTYTNTLASYKALVDLLTRARLDGSISMTAIADTTRPVSVWHVYNDTQSFLHQQFDGFLKGYWRNLLQTQPNHIEIVGEKNTIKSIIEPVAAEYCIPMTIGRGFCSLPPRYQIAQRFEKSGKDRLVLLIL